MQCAFHIVLSLKTMKQLVHPAAGRYKPALHELCITCTKCMPPFSHRSVLHFALLLQFFISRKRGNDIAICMCLLIGTIHYIMIQDVAAATISAHFIHRTYDIKYRLPHNPFGTGKQIQEALQLVLHFLSTIFILQKATLQPSAHTYLGRVLVGH